MSTNEIILQKVGAHRTLPASRPKVTPFVSKKHFDRRWWSEVPAREQAQRRIAIESVIMLEVALRRFG